MTCCKRCCKRCKCCKRSMSINLYFIILFFCSDKYKVSVYESAFNKVITKLTVYSVSSAETESSIRCVAVNDEGTSSTAFTIKYSDELQPIPGASSSANYIYTQFSLLSFTILLMCHSLLQL